MIIDTAPERSEQMTSYGLRESEARARELSVGFLYVSPSDETNTLPSPDTTPQKLAPTRVGTPVIDRPFAWSSVCLQRERPIEYGNVHESCRSAAGASRASPGRSPSWPICSDSEGTFRVRGRTGKMGARGSRSWGEENTFDVAADECGWGRKRGLSHRQAVQNAPPLGIGDAGNDRGTRHRLARMRRPG